MTGGRVLPCGCEWVGEFPANPWLEPSILVCGCEWVGEFPAQEFHRP